MPPRPRAACQICKTIESKYICSRCPTPYCSVPCYKQHKELSCNAKVTTSSTPNFHTHELEGTEDELKAKPGLRSLTSLNWPYVPEESAYPDPLKRDDPKPLQLHHYEAIATSPAIRQVLLAHPHLLAVLSSIDNLRGRDREQALQRALRVTDPDITEQPKSLPAGEPDENVLALRALAEAVETAVRGNKEGVLGLDWGSE